MSPYYSLNLIKYYHIVHYETDSTVYIQTVIANHGHYFTNTKKNVDIHRA